MNSTLHLVAPPRPGPRQPHRLAAGLNDPADGIVAIDCPVGVRHFSALAHPLFDALGQPRTTTSGRLRVTRHHVPQLIVNFAARPIRHVVMDHAQRCSQAVLVDLIHTATAADTSLWLIARPTSGDTLNRVLRWWPHQRDTWAGCRRTLTTAAVAPPTAPAADGREPGVQLFPPVARVEFPWFITQSVDSVDPAVRDTVVGAYYGAARTHREQLQVDPSTERCLAILRQQLLDATNIDHALTICRGASAGAFGCGVLLTVDADTLAAALPDDAWFAARSHRDWDHLHNYPNPQVPAVALLAANGRSVEAIANATIDDIHTVCDQVPPSQRTHLARLLLTASTHGATSNDPAFTLADGRPVNVRWVRETLGRLSTELDGPSPRQRRQPTRDPDHRWARRHGIAARLIPT